VNCVQATVSDFDVNSQAGEVIFDDGQVASFDTRAFGRSGLRMLRPGQRVKVDLDDGEIVRLTIATLPYPQ
jgi:2-phospho-L-lactate/phosphoenolpyruvate guanylyltransferase